MKIIKLYKLAISYSKNPAKIDLEEFPLNYNDLHKHTIDYHLNPNRSTRDETAIHVVVGVEPKNIDTGFISYSASYEIKVGETSKEELENEEIILRWAVSKIWDILHFDYIKAMQDLNIPISGFPVTPIIPTTKEKNKKGQNGSETSQQ